TVVFSYSLLPIPYSLFPTLYSLLPCEAQLLSGPRRSIILADSPPVFTKGSPMIAEAQRLYLSRPEIEAYQLERLRETLERAKHAPYFAERLKGRTVKSLADLATFPITTKEDLR